MVAHAVPLVAMAVMAAYVGTLFAGLYFALAGLTDARERRDYLTFALTCLSVVVFDAVTARFYLSRSYAEGLVWNRASLGASGLLGCTYMTFVWDFLKRPLPTTLRVVRFVIACIASLIIFWDSPYTQSSQRPSIKHVEVWGHPITYFEAENGPLTSLLFVSFFVAYATASVSMIRYFWSQTEHRQRGQWAFFAGTVLSGIAVTNDILVGSEIYQWLYLAEYGFTCTILSMGYVLLMRFADLRGRINMLNRSLSKTNDELVVALGKANESIRLKSEFLASISHELRTPLNAIINLPELVLEQITSSRTAVCAQCGERFMLDSDEQLAADTPCPMCKQVALHEAAQRVFEGDLDETHEHMETVVRAGRHLRGLVDDLLDASKLELGRAKLRLGAFDCAELVHEIANAVSTIAQPRGITIEQVTTERPTMLVADRTRVGQILYNLLSNAIKFSHEGGTVTVQLSTATDNALLICVRDRGIGIAPEDHSAVFERFRQVDGSTTRIYGGTGLGLAIVRDLVVLHGGRTWLESERGAGAAFFVQLPRALQQTPANDGSSQLVAAAS